MAETYSDYLQRSRPWRILAAAVEGNPRALSLVAQTFTELEADQDLGHYGRYRVREFKKLLGVA